MESSIRKTYTLNPLSNFSQNFSPAIFSLSPLSSYPPLFLFDKKTSHFKGWLKGCKIQEIN